MIAWAAFRDGHVGFYGEYFTKFTGVDVDTKQ